MDEGKTENDVSGVFEEKGIDKSSEAERFRQADSPREALLQMSKEGNFSQEYQQARVIGDALLPFLSKDGILARITNKHRRLKDAQLQQYASRLEPASSRDSWNKEAVSSAVQASLELSLLAAHAMSFKGEELESLIKKMDTPENAINLYKLKIAMNTAYAFFNQQQERNPNLVRVAIGKYCGKMGIFETWDYQKRKPQVELIMKWAADVFPRQDPRDFASPFYPYRKALREVTLTVPEVSPIDNLKPDPVVSQLQIKKERPLNRLLKLIKRPQKEPAQHAPVSALSEA